MKISIVISNRNGSSFLRACLDSILQEKSKQYEVIVVDDASTDSSKNILKDYAKKQNVQVEFLKKHVGISKARNTGASVAKGDVLLFLDTDTEIQTGWSKELIRFFKHHKKTAVAQPKLITKGTKRFDCAGELISSIGFLVERSQRQEDQGQFDTEEVIFSARGAAYAVRRDVFKNLGGFEEDYYFYLEDTDFSWRVWLAGYEVRFMPTIVVEHAYGTVAKTKSHYDNRALYYLGSRNTLLTLHKNLGISRLIGVLTVQYLCWLSLAILFAIKGELNKSRQIMRGILSSIGSMGRMYQKRKAIQDTRTIDDTVLFTTVGVHRRPLYFIEKAIDYLTS